MSTFLERYTAAKYTEQDIIHGIKLALELDTTMPVPDNKIKDVEAILFFIKIVEKEAYAKGELTISCGIKNLLGI